MKADPRRACGMALEAHRGRSYGLLPYEVHLGHVVAVLLRFDYEAPALLAAAWLHDVLEDTAVTSDRIDDAQGRNVRLLVEAVTDGLGSRSERVEGLITRISAIGGGALRWQAVNLKLADRIANVEASIMSRLGLLEMYRREHERFRDGLRPFGGDPTMWDHLDSLFSGEGGRGL